MRNRSEYTANTELARGQRYVWARIAPAVVNAARAWMPQDAADIRLERTLIEYGLMKPNNAIECIEAYDDCLALTFDSGRRLTIPTI